MSFISQIFQRLPEAPAKTPVDLTENRWLITKSSEWVIWLKQVQALFKQIRVVGNVNFGNTSAQTSSAESAIVVAITVNGSPFKVPVGSFIASMRVTDPATDLPVALASGAFFTYRMSADNEIKVAFCNFSAGAINPPEYQFEFLIELRA